jgi:hypothetical protein
MHFKRARDRPCNRRLDASTERSLIHRTAMSAIPAKRKIEGDIPQGHGFTEDDNRTALTVGDYDRMHAPIGTAVGVTAVTTGEKMVGVLLTKGGCTLKEAGAELDILVGAEPWRRHAGRRGICRGHGPEDHEAQRYPSQKKCHLLLCASRTLHGFGCPPWASVQPLP